MKRREITSEDRTIVKKNLLLNEAQQGTTNSRRWERHIPAHSQPPCLWRVLLS